MKKLTYADNAGLSPFPHLELAYISHTGETDAVAAKYLHQWGPILLYSHFPGDRIYITTDLPSSIKSLSLPEVSKSPLRNPSGPVWCSESSLSLSANSSAAFPHACCLPWGWCAWPHFAKHSSLTEAAMIARDQTETSTIVGWMPHIDGELLELVI